jgi:hypothetical protein
VAILAAAFHPHRAGALLAVSIGGYALAWCAGLVAFVLPAGAGARDLVLGAALSAVIPSTTAVVVVVVSRVVTTLCDLGCAGLAVLIGRNRLSGRPPSSAEVRGVIAGEQEPRGEPRDAQPAQPVSGQRPGLL